MQKIILDITMSLDGYVAGTDINSSQPLGENGSRLHDWLFKSKSAQDAEVIAETWDQSGAVIVGGTTYHDAIDGVWGGVTPFSIPAFIVTKRMERLERPGFTFVADGYEKALILARTAAQEKNVLVMGGAKTIQYFIKNRIYDELRLHLAPLLLGKGIRLFEENGTAFRAFENIETIRTVGATHLVFRPVA